MVVADDDDAVAVEDPPAKNADSESALFSDGGSAKGPLDDEEEADNVDDEAVAAAAVAAEDVDACAGVADDVEEDDDNEEMASGNGSNSVALGGNTGPRRAIRSISVKDGNSGMYAAPPLPPLVALGVDTSPIDDSGDDGDDEKLAPCVDTDFGEAEPDVDAATDDDDDEGVDERNVLMSIVSVGVEGVRDGVIEVTTAGVSKANNGGKSGIK